jgi:hypothetical protein
MTSVSQRAEDGEASWINRPRADSCHTVWMELHEDLIATLGVQRGAEFGDPSAFGSQGS